MHLNEHGQNLNHDETRVPQLSPSAPAPAVDLKHANYYSPLPAPTLTHLSMLCEEHAVLLLCSHLRHPVLSSTREGVEAQLVGEAVRLALPVHITQFIQRANGA